MQTATCTSCSTRPPTAGAPSAAKRWAAFFNVPRYFRGSSYCCCRPAGCDRHVTRCQLPLRLEALLLTTHSLPPSSPHPQPPRRSATRAACASCSPLSCPPSSLARPRVRANWVKGLQPGPPTPTHVLACILSSPGGHLLPALVRPSYPRLLCTTSYQGRTTLQLGLLHSLPPLWAAALVDICCDDQRHILYTRSQASVLQASGWEWVKVPAAGWP